MAKFLSIEDILGELIAFNTISGSSTTEIMEYLAVFSKKLGFETVFIPDPHNSSKQNLLCHIGKENLPSLMLCGHVDVVPVLGQNWDSDPFILKNDNGKLIGRGVCDMKGFLACVYYMLQNLPLTSLKRPLSLLWTFDEEVGCLGSMEAIGHLTKLLPSMPKSCLIGEPTNFNLYTKHKGHTTLLIKVKGESAHSSKPFLGVSAIKALNKALCAIFELSQKYGEFCINVGKIEGGSAVNIVPEEAMAIIGFRVLPKMKMQEVYSKIEEAVFTKTKDEKAKITLQVINDIPSMHTKDNSELENMLFPISNGSLERLATFATDGGNLSQTGIECVVFGPGDIEVAHKANEWVMLSDLNRYTQRLLTVFSIL